MNHLQTLMRYKQWTNAILFETASRLTPEQLNASQPIVFGSIAKTLNHTLAMDRVWQAHLRGEVHGMETRNPKDCPGLAELNERQAEMDTWFIEYADALTETEAGQIIDFNFIGGRPGSMTRADMLIHVANHGTYHRGNVVTMMYACSVRPPPTDYPVFIQQQNSAVE